MHRIDTPGSIDGRFSDGNPAIGQQATQVLAKWFNSLQDELVHVIEQAGITLDDADNEQLYDAIIALIAGVVGDGSGAVPTTRKVLTTGGLLTGGGNLSADRTIGLLAASVAEVAALTISDKVVTPEGLAGLVGWTSTGNSRVLNVGQGKIIGMTAFIPENSLTVVNLPDTFTQPCRAVANGSLTNNFGYDDNPPQVVATGTSTVTLFSPFDHGTNVNIIAMGV